MRKVAIVGTFNGEGYSEPTVNVAEFGEESAKVIAEEIAELTNVDCEFEVQIGDNAGKNQIMNVTYTDGDDEDAGAVSMIELEPGKATILIVQPCCNTVSVFGTYDTEEEAKKTLSIVANNEDMGWDECDVEDFNDDPLDMFASHGNDDFLHYHIVKG